MDSTAFALVATGVAVAAFVQGTTGVGFALIVAPVLGLLAPEMLPASLLILMLPLNVYVAWRERAALDKSGASWIALGRFVGTFGGLLILTALTAAYLNMLIGAVTILAAVITLFLPAFRASRQSFIAAGLVTGITETATGIGGPPLALVYQHHAPAILRSTIALSFLLGEIISLAMLAVAGKTNKAQLVGALTLLPALVVGAAVSRLLHQRVQGRRLRVFVLLFAIASGGVLLLRG